MLGRTCPITVAHIKPAPFFEKRTQDLAAYIAAVDLQALLLKAGLQGIVAPEGGATTGDDQVILSSLLGGMSHNAYDLQVGLGSLPCRHTLGAQTGGRR